jgi:hypothetical protein
MTTVYLHIGTPKTGTTSIQKFFSTYIEEIVKKGFLYPLSGRYPHPNYDQFSHHNLVWYLTQGKMGFYIPDYGNYDGLSEEIDLINPNNVLISSESFCKLNYDQILSLKNCLSRYKVKVIIYFRRQDDFFQSYYFEKISEGAYCDNIKTYIQDCKSTPFWNYYKIIEQWQAFFGKENIIVRLYDKENLKNGLIDDFLSAINLSIDNIKLQEGNKNNITADIKTIHIMRLLNSIFVDKFSIPSWKMRKIYFRLFLNPESQISRLIEKLPDIFFNHESLKLSIQERINLMKEFEESNQKVAREYLGRQDGRLFYSTPEHTESN